MSTAQANIFTEPRWRLWTSEEYYRLAEAGLFEGKRVELIGGRVIEMSAQSRPHVRAVKRATRTFERAFGEGWFVQSQAPLDLDDRAGVKSKHVMPVQYGA
jgi:putative restriction endonuclease